MLTVARRLSLVLVPATIPLLATAILLPPKQWLTRRGLPDLPATLVTFGCAVAVGALGAAVIVPPLAGEALALRTSLAASVVEIRRWLIEGPASLSPAQVDQGSALARDESGRHAGAILHGALDRATIAVEVSISAVLAGILAFVIVKDAAAIVGGVTRLLTERQQRHAEALRLRVWTTLCGYVRGVAVNASVNAALMAAGLTALSVPAVLPLALITFATGFFPMVSAFVAGAVAALVALAAAGPETTALVIG